jgi:hypothetical protein
MSPTQIDPVPKNPTRMHAFLVYTGKWMIAAQLKIDYEVGRLAG